MLQVILWNFHMMIEMIILLFELSQHSEETLQKFEQLDNGKIFFLKKQKTL